MNTTAYWHHIVVTGSSDGVKLTITNSNSGDAIVTDVVLSETNVNPTSLIIEPCCGGAIGIDELSLSYYVEGEVIQTPLAAYTSVNGINRTITATCATEGATLYHSTDGENWTEGASLTISESGNVYFKAVKGNSESDVLTFAAEAGTEIVLNAPDIVRNANGTVTISADQSKLLLAPTATIYYTYGEENGSFTGSKELTVAADATITAYAEAEGYTKSADATRAVALFPEDVDTLFSVAAATKGWSANAFNAETITASERTYATLLLDEAAWSENVLLQTNGAWGLRASGNWYIDSNTDNSWLLVKDTKAGNIIVVDATFAPAETVNATYAEKYSFGTKHAYTITADGNAEFALIKPAATEMNYFYGVYGYSFMSDAEKALIEAKAALQADIDAAKAIDTTGKKLAESLANAITEAETQLNAAEATVENLQAAQMVLAKVVEAYYMENAKNIFVKPGPWNVDGARYTAYTWNDNGNKWFDFAAAEEEGVFTVAIPEYYTGLILARMKGDAAENNWDNKWNQTDDIDFTAVADSTLFTITGWGEEKSPYETSKYAPAVAPVLNTYTATFTTNAEWEKVYAYVWSGEGENKVLGDWPGTELEATEGVYTVTIQAENAPEFIIFNNGLENEALQQTTNLAFENGKAYEYTVEEPVKTDYTDYIVNADLTGEGGFDATGTKGISGGIVKAGNNAQFDFKQTIENLPAGQYKVTAHAAYRYSNDENQAEQIEYNAIQAGTETKFAKLYATVGTKTVETLVQNRWDGASDTDYANGDGSVVVNEKYVPNSSNAVKAWFNAGKYVNEVVFNLPADGDVTIGIVKTAQPEAGDYTVIGPWTLTRLGDAEEEPEPEVPTLANGDFEGEYTVYSNPSGDRAIYQPEGWTVSYNNGDSNDMTALNSECLSWNNFENKPQLSETGGNNSYWVRFRWGNSETLTLSQEVTLAAGTYKLSADAFFNGANGAAATISAAGQSAAITGNSTWANHKVVFNVAEEGTVTIALNVTQTQQVENIAAFDNVKLETYDPMEGAKDELLAAITAAKAIETEGKAGVEELNAAITDAETALNNAEATVESLNAAKTALAAAIAEFEDINITVPALAGWTRVRTTNIENTADNYYVLVDANSLNYVMANEADHYRPCYKTVADPVANPSFAWTLEGSDNTFALKSFSTGSYFVQADGWNTSMTGSTGSATFQFTQNDGIYTLKCVQSNALVGHWNDSGAAVAEDGENIAANKQAKDAPGFYLFAMPKATYEAAILAARTEATAGASKENGIDVTAWIQNADWTGDYGGWARSGSWGNMQWGQKTLEVWNATNVVVKQTLTAVPDGTYKLTADVISGNGDNKVAFVYGTGGATVKSDAVTAEASAGNYNTMSAEVAGNTLTADNIVVTGGVLTVGLDIAAGWIVADNFKLYYYGEDMSQYAQAYHDALTAAQAIDTTAPMNGDVLSALNTALTTYASVDETDKATLLAATTALSTATEAATASIAAYAKAAEMLPKMKQLTEETNVYTAEALASYYTQWADKYEAKTLTTEEANALQNPYTQTGWQHDANMKVDDLLLSAWSFGDVKAKDYETALYINTWSIEGNNDGSEFRVPFFEYWTNDGNSLGEKTLTATMTALAAGTYNVTALVRVRIKNGAEAPAYGITFQANEGEAVNVTGDQVGETQMYLKEVTATGTVAEDGVLKIKFNVAADNNISWLSFKNVKFEKVEPAEPVYYVVGTMNDWTPSDEYKMTLNEEAEGVVEYMLTLDLEANAELKVVKGNKDVWYPDGMDNNYVIDADGTYTIYFRPNADGGDDWYQKVIYVAKKENAQPEFPENVIYSWESPAGEPIEYGGTIAYVNGDGDRLNYAQGGYYTICLNGKKGNLDDKTASANAGHMVITLENAVEAGDTIFYTAFLNKNESKTASPYFVFENGTTAEGEVFSDEANINAAFNGVPTLKYTIVPEDAAGSKTITLTRSQTGTNLFITKLQIMQYDPTTGISIVKTAIENGAIYNLNGQKVNKAQKGLYIINGKKVVIK